MSHERMMASCTEETDAAVAKLTQDMAQVINPQSSNPDLSSRIVHMVADQAFKHVANNFASEMIERQILVRFHRGELRHWSLFAESVKGIDGS